MADYKRLILHTFLSLLSALFLLLLFPNYNFTWLAPVALTPLLIALARTPIRRQPSAHSINVPKSPAVSCTWNWVAAM